MLRKLLSILGVICLAVTFIASGLGVCAGIPQTTQLLAQANSDFKTSPYSQETLISLANEIRNFTILDYGRKSDGDNAATQALIENISAITNKSYDFNNYQYFLDKNSISHLNDVHSVIDAVFIPFLLTALAAIVLLIFIYITYGKLTCGNILITSGIITMTLILTLSSFAAFGFDAFFETFHSIFFTEGTWTFPYDSLLICAYPIGFWICMAAIWATTTLLLSIISICTGIILRKQSKTNIEPS